MDAAGLYRMPLVVIYSSASDGSKFILSSKWRKPLRGHHIVSSGDEEWRLVPARQGASLRRLLLHAWKLSSVAFHAGCVCDKFARGINLKKTAVVGWFVRVWRRRASDERWKCQKCEIIVIMFQQEAERKWRFPILCAAVTQAILC